VVLFDPTLLAFTFHWYDGEVPPFVGVAVKVTDVPAQVGLEDGTTDTLTGSIGFTFMVREFDVAGLPVVQERFDVNTQVTTSLFKGI
jgi:hypothetical protein